MNLADLLTHVGGGGQSRGCASLSPSPSPTSPSSARSPPLSLLSLSLLLPHTTSPTLPTSLPPPPLTSIHTSLTTLSSTLSHSHTPQWGSPPLSGGSSSFPLLDGRRGGSDVARAVQLLRQLAGCSPCLSLSHHLETAQQLLSLLLSLSSSLPAALTASLSRTALSILTRQQASLTSALARSLSQPFAPHSLKLGRRLWTRVGEYVRRVAALAGRPTGDHDHDHASSTYHLIFHANCVGLERDWTTTLASLTQPNLPQPQRHHMAALVARLSLPATLTTAFCPDSPSPTRHASYHRLLTHLTTTTAAALHHHLARGGLVDPTTLALVQRHLAPLLPPDCPLTSALHAASLRHFTRQLAVATASLVADVPVASLPVALPRQLVRLLSLAGSLCLASSVVAPSLASTIKETAASLVDRAALTPAKEEDSATATATATDKEDVASAAASDAIARALAADLDACPAPLSPNKLKLLLCNAAVAKEVCSVEVVVPPDAPDAVSLSLSPFGQAEAALLTAATNLTLAHLPPLFLAHFGEAVPSLSSLPLLSIASTLDRLALSLALYHPRRRRRTVSLCLSLAAALAVDVATHHATGQRTLPRALSAPVPQPLTSTLTPIDPTTLADALARHTTSAHVDLIVALFAAAQAGGGGGALGKLSGAAS